EGRWKMKFRHTPFAVAGLAIVALVLDETDGPHDNLKSVAILAAGAALGAVASVWLVRRDVPEERATRVRRIAWDLVRYVLAFEMVRYGTAKLIGMQFYPQYWRLDQRIVDLRPMALAWAFFGQSFAYQAFGGAIEVVSGVFVSFRRTALLGACLMATALVNVVLVNFCYDVPVKLFATVYLLLDVALIARDAPRLRE